MAFRNVMLDVCHFQQAFKKEAHNTSCQDFKLNSPPHSLSNDQSSCIPMTQALRKKGFLVNKKK